MSPTLKEIFDQRFPLSERDDVTDLEDISEQN